MDVPLFTEKTARGKSENKTQTQGFEYHQQQQKTTTAVATAINNSKCKCLIESARLIDLNPEIENNTQTPIFYCSTLSTLRALPFSTDYFQIHTHTCKKTHRPFLAKNRHGMRERSRNGTRKKI